jgi:hypothetical protein
MRKQPAAADCLKDLFYQVSVAICLWVTFFGVSREDPFPRYPELVQVDQASVSQPYANPALFANNWLYLPFGFICQPGSICHTAVFATSGFICHLRLYLPPPALFAN